MAEPLAARARAPGAFVIAAAPRAHIKSAWKLREKPRRRGGRVHWPRAERAPSSASERQGLITVSCIYLSLCQLFGFCCGDHTRQTTILKRARCSCGDVRICMLNDHVIFFFYYYLSSSRVCTSNKQTTLY